MNPNDLIKLEELKELVGSDKVSDWLNKFLERYRVSAELKEFIRLKKGVTKELLEEILPLSIYATYQYNDSDVYMQFYPGSTTSYDADFVNESGVLVERVEVTMALDGLQSQIQGEAINIFGHSSVYHTPDYLGHVKTRIIAEPECRTISSIEIIEKQAAMLNEAYAKKHMNIHKYPNTTLLIGMDIPLFMEQEYNEIMNKFNLLENTFKKIVCVNTSGSHCWRLK